MTAGVLTVAALVGAAWLASSDEPGPAAAGETEYLADAAPTPRVTVRTAEILVPETTPDLRPPIQSDPPTTPAARARGTSAPTRQTARVAPAPAKPAPLPRRLARLITGDGRHEVRPFPTVADERR